MPLPADPNKPEFYVYHFEITGYPFYVGIGRAGRALYRNGYVRSLFTPKNAQKLSQSSLSIRVMAALIRREREPELKLIFENLTRAKALELERREIKRLLVAGYVLANRQQNPFWRERDEDGIVAAILSGEKRSEASAAITQPQSKRSPGPGAKRFRNVNGTKATGAKRLPYVKSQPGDREIIYKLLLEHPNANKEDLVKLIQGLALDHSIPMLTIAAARKSFVSTVSFLKDQKLLNFEWSGKR
jgi:hypothetical protein